MIYIAVSAGKNIPQTETFKSRNIPNLTFGSLSDVVIFGKPTQVQLAYAGYKEAIEAFLFSTAIKSRVLISNEAYPLPPTYTTTFPLQYPPVIFRLAKDASPETIGKLMRNFEHAGINRVEVGKGRPTFTLDRPTREILLRLPGISQVSCPSVERYMQAGLIPYILRVYACIDLFCRVNTYSYKKTDGVPANEITVDSIDDISEMRHGMSMWYRDGFGSSKDHPAAKKPKKDEPRGEYEGDEEEQTDLTPDRARKGPVNSAVLVAKPSPKPASTSFGSPTSVPFSRGLLFPYFDQMIRADTRSLRDLISLHFFRCLGDQGQDLKTAYASFRDYIGSLTNTPTAASLIHILKGIDLALQTQTQAFFLFDEKVYLGFCLLGEEFRIFHGGRTYEPLGAQDLREELNMIETRGNILSTLATKLETMLSLQDEMVSIATSDIDTCMGLSGYLSRVKVEGGSEDEKEISRLLRKMEIQTKFKSIKNSKNVIWAIQHLTTLSHDPLPVDLVFHIPYTGWSDIGTREYRIFAAFGPRSFSLRTGSGEELRIARTGETCPFEVRNDKGELLRPNLMLGEKVISECLKAWKDLKVKRSMRMDFEKRAKGSMYHSVTVEAEKREILDALKAAANANMFGTGSVDEEKGKKRSVDEAFGTVDLDSLFD